LQHFDLYKGFAKKENSTKQPSSGTLTLAVQGYFKEPCSILNPVLNIERLSSDAVPYDYNYARYTEGNRYYFIEDWVWVNGLWEVHMKEDVLGTWKDVIGAQTEYILRTDSSNNPLNFDGAITDGMYPATTNFSIDRVGFRTPFINDISDGTYVLGIISNESNKFTVGWLFLPHINVYPKKAVYGLYSTLCPTYFYRVPNCTLYFARCGRKSFAYHWI
jgi:hypothetical protein